MKLLKNNFFKFSIAFILISLFSQNITASEKAYKKIALELSKSALAHGIKNIAISKFSSGDFSNDSETNYISDRLTQQLAKDKDLNILERSQLGKVLEEIKSASIRSNQYNSAEQVAKILPAEAIVTGTIYENFMATKVLVKLVAIKTGKILAAIDSEIEGQMKQPEMDDIDFKLPELDLANPSSFKDA
ncbi:MAG: CsgG/HfaB family protein, partial [Elusimicrobia bacterium]|nr:CsgG/HfaB family protein [Elusimicrobiota bacterium]